MRTVGPVRQVQSRHVERHAVEAISQRLGHHVADAVIGSTREAGGSVILHLNSGGNASAAESRLRALGYCVEPTDYDSYGPGRYGVKLRVSPEIRRRGGAWQSYSAVCSTSGFAGQLRQPARDLLALRPRDAGSWRCDGAEAYGGRRTASSEKVGSGCY